MLQSVDEAKVMIETLIEYVISCDNWERRLLEGTEVFVSHIERDGVVGGSGDRAANERPERAQHSVVRFRLRALPYMGNQFGAVHGGYSAGLIDVLSSLVIALHTSGEPGEPWSTLGVTNNLSINYMLPTTIMQWIEFEVRALRVGRAQALTAIDIYELDGREGKRTRLTISATHAKTDVSSKI
ncbi:hypothetical protein MCUN1_000733 [Malassezia cuniculi]|uniref:Thioesterase domain-containing protein n=1 Tax=Malassezia cuniculi TaxID=948313 RepID=A0AAF0EW81_9BASI|nr:hypothetical protein MCUN1_000733 [Malassezia cuniculi]